MKGNVMNIVTSIAPASQPGKRFLDHFDQCRRSWVTNQFCFAVREGTQTSEMVLAAVNSTIHHRITSSSYTGDDRRKVVELLDCIRDHPEDALVFAQLIISREAVPTDVRDREKVARSAYHRDAWMATQPPTDKQITYLKQPGDVGEVPSNRLEATRLLLASRNRGRHG
jgi:hypothetical protein